jgi:hypothetical protein
MGDKHLVTWMIQNPIPLATNKHNICTYGIKDCVYASMRQLCITIILHGKSEKVWVRLQVQDNKMNGNTSIDYNLYSP